MRTTNIIILVFLFFTLSSCEVMQGVSAGLGTCSYHSIGYSYSNGEWKSGVITKASLPYESKVKIADWAKSRCNYYASLKRLQNYYENDPYENRQYKFVVECI